MGRKNTQLTAKLISDVALTVATGATIRDAFVAHGVNETTLEAYGSAGAVQYRLGREAPGWWAGELKLSRGGAFEPVALRAPVPAIASTEAFEQIGRGTIAPLVARFLDAMRTGVPPSPSLADGLRAQLVLDAAATAAARGTWIDIPQLTV